MKGISSFSALILLCLLWSNSTLKAQQTVYLADSTEQSNIRHVYSSLQVLQGISPEVSVYQDRDPNGGFIFRNRGINSLEKQHPLIVVDGIQDFDLAFLNPNEIASVTINNTLFSSLKYGLNGSNSVIEIKTRNQSHDNQTQIKYAGYLAASRKSNEVDVLSAKEYTAIGGPDLGDSKNWQESVSREAVSQTHLISFSGNSELINYQASGLYEFTEGILKSSAFERYMIRSGMNARNRTNTIQFKANAFIGNRVENPSFVEAFRYAVIYNPTSPTRFESGDFYQPILFDNFNPLAILGQSIARNENRSSGISTDLSYAILENLAFRSTFSSNVSTYNNGQFFSVDSFFRGFSANGLAVRTDMEQEFISSQNSLRYSTKLMGNSVFISAGLDHWKKKSEIEEMLISNIGTDVYGFNIPDVFEQSEIQSTLSKFPSVKNTSLFITTGMTGNVFSIESMFRNEQFNVLGNDHGREVHGGILGDLNLSELLKTELFDELKTTLSYAKTGVMPGEYGLGLAKQEFDSFLGDFRFVRDSNENLVLSTIQEISIGFSGSLLDNRVSFNLEVYDRSTDDIITPAFLPIPESLNGSGLQYQNNVDLSTRGVELGIGFSAIILNRIKATSQVSISSYSIIVESFPEIQTLVGYPGAPGQGSVQMVRVKEGRELGEIWGPVFNGIDDFGFPIFKDINGDGEIRSLQFQALQEGADFKVLGNAYPDFELGWHNQLMIKNFNLEFLFRGAFGHSLINMNRMFYESNDPGAIGSYNRVRTEKAVDGLTANLYSSLYVEKADFIKLDYITFSYDFDLTAIQQINSFTIMATIENVLTLTNYTGVSPEPILNDFGPYDNGGFRTSTPSLLASGIDRRSNYLPARTILFGIQLSFN